jgi:hypothetical protein
MAKSSSLYSISRQSWEIVHVDDVVVDVLFFTVCLVRFLFFQIIITLEKDMATTLRGVG